SDMSGKDGQNGQRKKLDEPDVTQTQRGVRALIDFPADRNFLHLLAENQRKVAGDIPSKTGNAQWGVRIVPVEHPQRAENFWYQVDPAPGPTRATTTSMT